MNNKFDNDEINALVKQIKTGNERAAIKFYSIFKNFIEGIVRKYSGKTAIKDDNDLRSYICISYYYAILNFDPLRHTQFKNYAYYWIKKVVFSEEQKFRTIKIPINQKIFFDAIIKEYKNKDENYYDYLSNKDIIKIRVVENTHTLLFSSFGTDDEPDPDREDLVCKKSEEKIENETIKKEEQEKLRYNINVVLTNFNTEERLIIEHSFGLNGKKLLDTNELASFLDVSNSTLLSKKNRIIKLMRHTSLTEYLLH